MAIELNIKGNARVLKFNQFTYEHFLSNVHIDDVKGVAKITPSSMIYAIAYAALKSGYYAKGIEEDFTFEDVVDLIDEMDNSGKHKETFIAIHDEFIKIRQYRELIEASKIIQEQEQDQKETAADKKKVT